MVCYCVSSFRRTCLLPCRECALRLRERPLSTAAAVLVHSSFHRTNQQIGSGSTEMLGHLSVPMLPVCHRLRLHGLPVSGSVRRPTKLQYRGSSAAGDMALDTHESSPMFRKRLAWRQTAAASRQRTSSRHHHRHSPTLTLKNFVWHICRRLFWAKLRAVRERLTRRRAAEAAAAMEAERRAAAAAAAESRLKWVVDRLEAPYLHATACPVCPPPDPAARGETEM